MYCNQCGRELHDGTKFCAFCGQKAVIPPAETATDSSCSDNHEPVIHVDGSEMGTYKSSTPGLVCSLVGMYTSGLIMTLLVLQQDTWVIQMSSKAEYIFMFIVLFVIELMPGILGLILSDKAIKRNCENTDVAKAGKMTGIVSLLICAVTAVVMVCKLIG